MRANLSTASKSGSIPVGDIFNMHIGQHWNSVGQGGIEHSSGHEVVINGIVAGLLYMGAKTNAGDNQGRADEVNVIFKGCGFDTEYRTEHQIVADNKQARKSGVWTTIIVILVVLAFVMSFLG